MAGDRTGSKMDVIVKLVLVFFISLLSFSIGTFVGKKFSDNQHKLAQLEPGEHSEEMASEEHGEERGVASVSPEAGEVKPNEALSDEEIAKLAEEFVTDETEDPKEEHPKVDKNSHGDTVAKDEHHEEPAAEEHHEKEAPAPAKKEAREPAKVEKHKAPAEAARHETEPSHVADRVAQGKAPTEEKTAIKRESRIPASLPKDVASSATGKYTVQVAAYPDEGEAQKVTADLKSKGFSAFYVNAKVKNKTWYRVSVGLFTTKKEADAYKKDLLARSKVSAAMVQKIVSE